jgi:hypothetical protein
MSVQVRDIQPRELADGLAALAAHIGEQDDEAAAILRDAQRRLEALAWNRYAAHMTRRSAGRDLVRRARQLMASRGH